jgi:hypothetical protein
MILLPSACGALLLAVKLVMATGLGGAVIGKDMLAVARLLSGASAVPVLAHTDTAALGLAADGVHVNVLLRDQF